MEGVPRSRSFPLGNQLRTLIRPPNSLIYHNSHTNSLLTKSSLQKPARSACLQTRLSPIIPIQCESPSILCPSPASPPQSPRNMPTTNRTRFNSSLSRQCCRIFPPVLNLAFFFHLNASLRRCITLSSYRSTIAQALIQSPIHLSAKCIRNMSCARQSRTNKARSRSDKTCPVMTRLLNNRFAPSEHHNIARILPFLVPFLTVSQLQRAAILFVVDHADANLGSSSSNPTPHQSPCLKLKPSLAPLPRRAQRESASKRRVRVHCASVHRSRATDSVADPNAPKRGLSAYMFFANEQRDKVRSDDPSLKFGTCLHAQPYSCLFERL